MVTVQLWFASRYLLLSSFEATRWLANLTAFNSGEARSIHLAFAILLCFLSYPAFKKSPRNRVPAADWTLAIVGASCAFYLFLFSRDYMNWVFGTTLSDRPANPNDVDVIVSVIGVLVLLEATRRSLGPTARHRRNRISRLHSWALRTRSAGLEGASFGAVADQQWLSTEGVFGIALGVSTDLVFLFVLFGALLEKAGAGNYFIKVAFSLMGHLRGGPAKAAVVASAMTGSHLRFIHRQCRDHRHLHHPDDAPRGLHARKGRCGRGGFLGQWPDHAACHGRSRVPDGRVRGGSATSKWSSTLSFRR